MSEPESRSIKAAVVASIQKAADRLAYVRSLTIAGSFVTSPDLQGISDIDTVVIVDQINAERFVEVIETFRKELSPTLHAAGWDLRINSSFGPLKINEPRVAVLHLMVYSATGHRDHAIRSPFTCLDWQRSECWQTRRLCEIYPVFGLQPRHFFGARRSAADYLADLASGAISYRELRFDGGCREVKLSRQMDLRDRHEFSYHVLRFLMQNLLKLVHRDNQAREEGCLIRDFTSVFPKGMDQFGPLLLRLAGMKATRNFLEPIPNLLEQVSAFVTMFESQFRAEFEHGAIRQTWIRHAPTSANVSHRDDPIFQGRSDSSILDPCTQDLSEARAAWEELGRPRAHASQLLRARQTAAAITGQEAESHMELNEISYGRCEGMTFTEAIAAYPYLREGWAQGADPTFPEGECSEDVRNRVLRFLDRQQGTAFVVSHNVVLRELIGTLIGVPTEQRHRLHIPHLTPIGLIHSPRHGWFLNLTETAEAAIFHRFFSPKDVVFP